MILSHLGQFSSASTSKTSSISSKSSSSTVKRKTTHHIRPLLPDEKLQLSEELTKVQNLSTYSRKSLGLIRNFKSRSGEPKIFFDHKNDWTLIYEDSLFIDEDGDIASEFYIAQPNGSFSKIEQELFIQPSWALASKEVFKSMKDRLLSPLFAISKL